jgi:hypothetical protein
MSTERWYYINNTTGSIMYHCEPDGWSYLRDVQKGQRFDNDEEVVLENLDVYKLARLIGDLKPGIEVPSKSTREELLEMVKTIMIKKLDS